MVTPSTVSAMKWEVTHEEIREASDAPVFPVRPRSFRR